MKFPTTLLFLTLILPAQSEPAAQTKNQPTLQLIHRCDKTLRLAAIKKHGGAPNSEQSVLQALRYLKITQNKNGSWSTSRRVPMTSFALLTFLGHGETTQSKEFGSSVLNAIQYLIEVAVKNKGKLTSDMKDKKWPYEHAIATYALAEAYLLCEKGFGEEIPKLKRAVEITGQFIIDHQHQRGGWEYNYSMDNNRGGNVSLTTWHLNALKSCQLSRLEFNNLNPSYNRGLYFIQNCQISSGAIGYSAPRLQYGQDGTTLAALGAYCFQIWKAPSSQVSRKAVHFIDKEMKFDWKGHDSDLYGHFFAAQTMFQHGGPEWQRYHKLVFPQILKNQAPDGSFLPVNTEKKQPIKAVSALFNGPDRNNTHLRTCFATLILQTYYRHSHSTAHP